MSKEEVATEMLAHRFAIMAAIGNVTKLGVLVREGDALERLAKVRKVAFDKTGTLTYGRPEVVAVGTIEGSKVDEEQLYSLVASAESIIAAVPAVTPAPQCLSA